MERIVNGERIELKVLTPDEIISNTISPLKNFQESDRWRWKKFMANLTDLVMDHPELKDFAQKVVSTIKEKHEYHFITSGELAYIHDEILNMWKYYKRDEGRRLHISD